MSGSSDRIGEFLAARVGAGWMPGATWWVGDAAGAIACGSVGQAAIQPVARASGPETPYDLASLTKALVTAPLLVQLEEQDLLALESRAEELLPELRGSGCGGASLLSLASHTSGLPAWRPLYLEASGIAGYLEALAAIPVDPAGPELYSDLGYIVLGAVLERVTGSTLRELFRERIAQPLGLPRAGFADLEAFSDAAATECGDEHERKLAAAEGSAHAWRATIPPGEPHDGNAHALGGAAGHAGLFGTAAEVAEIALEILHPRRLRLGPRARRRLLESLPGTNRTVGWITATGSAAARGILPAAAPGHVGFTGTSVWLDPERATAHVLLTDRVHPAVTGRPFHLVRRAFHRLSAAAVRSRGTAGAAG